MNDKELINLYLETHEVTVVKHAKPTYEQPEYLIPLGDLSGEQAKNRAKDARDYGRDHMRYANLIQTERDMDGNLIESVSLDEPVDLAMQDCLGLPKAGRYDISSSSYGTL